MVSKDFVVPDGHLCFKDLVSGLLIERLSDGERCLPLGVALGMPKVGLRFLLLTPDSSVGFRVTAIPVVKEIIRESGSEWLIVTVEGTYVFLLQEHEDGEKTIDFIRREMILFQPRIDGITIKKPKCVAK